MTHILKIQFLNDQMPNLLPHRKLKKRNRALIKQTSATDVDLYIDHAPCPRSYTIY